MVIPQRTKNKIKIIKTVLAEKAAYKHPGLIFTPYLSNPASQVALVVKNLPATAGVVRDTGLIPGSGRTPGGGHGNPLQYSCLEKPMVRGAWQHAVHRVTQSQTRLKLLSMHAHHLVLSLPVYRLYPHQAVPSMRLSSSSINICQISENYSGLPWFNLE